MKTEDQEARRRWVKQYARIDYEDDDELVDIMIEATVQSMAEVIPAFRADAMTARQKIILAATVKDLYDHREKYGKDVQKMKIACASMLLSEIYEPKGVAASEQGRKSTV